METDQSLWNRPHLTGDRFGLRSSLSDRGISFDSSLKIDTSRNFQGGVDTTKTLVRQLFDANATIDTERLFGWQSGTVFVDYQNQSGPYGAIITGDVQGFANNGTDGISQVSQLWFEQRLFDNYLQVKVGKVDANAEFAYVEHGSEFLNSSMGYSPTIFVYTAPLKKMFPTSFGSRMSGAWRLKRTFAEQAGTTNLHVFLNDVVCRFRSLLVLMTISVNAVVAGEPTTLFDDTADPQAVVPFLLTQQPTVGGTSPYYASDATMFSNAATSPDDDPDVANSGPDMGDFPYSAYTLRQGRVQLEMSPTTVSSRNANNPANYSTPFLFRYGVTNDVEFRLIGTGITSLGSPDPTTGFGPLMIDTKIHLWNDRMEYFLPAVSFEAALQTDLGSPAFRIGTQPLISVNMDFPFTTSTNFEVSIGYTGSQTTVNVPAPASSGNPAFNLPTRQNYNLFYVQWALEQQITQRFKGFVHGYTSTPVNIAVDPSSVIGIGGFYQLTKRSMLFGSANAGLTHVVPPFSTQVGLAFTF